MDNHPLKQMLTKGMDAATATFAVIDCASTAAVTDDDTLFLRLSEPAVEKHPLLTGESAWTMARSAPYLVRLDTQPALAQWLIENSWGQAQAIFFTSHADLQTLLTHLRACFDVRAENGRQVYFRFFDPLILGQLLPTLSPPEGALFFGPIQRFVIEDEHGQPQVFDRPLDQVVPDMPPGRLILSKRALFSEAWNRRLLHRHAAKYQALGFRVHVDPDSNRLTIEDKVGAKATLQKTAEGVTTTTGLGRTVQYGLTACKSPTWVVDPAGNRIDLDIQERENIVTGHKQPLLYAIRMARNRKRWVLDYDQRNHLQSIDYPDGTQALFEHDPYGHLQGHTDRNGYTSHFERDHQERLTRHVDANGQATRFDYDDRLAPSRIAFADGAAFDFSYTDAGHLQTFLANDQRVADYSVDPDSGSWRVAYTDGTWGHFSVENGRVVRAENQAGTLVLTYDENGTLAAESFNRQTVTYRRDALGQLTAIVAPDGQTIAFGRDKDQRVNRIVDWSGRSLAVAYAPNGVMESIAYPNGVRLEQNTAASGLPERMTLTGPDAPIFDRRFARDLADRVVRIRDAETTVAYAYDQEGRLLGATSDRAENNETFTLDPKANRLADAHGRYTIDAADRLAQPGYAYDGLGNQTEASGPTGQNAYNWASANRLASAATPGSEARYAYDAFGRRVAKQVNGIRTRYVWAGAQLLQEIVQGPDGDRTIDYLFFPGTPVLLALRQNQRMYYAAFGHRYETLCLTDTNGAVAWQADYDAFGNARIQKGADIYQPLRLAGHYHDAETGLHYSAARYYNPRLGRYLSLDPLFTEGGGENFYAYCDGDPINRIDPHGELFFVPILIGMAIGAAIGAGIEYYRQRQEGKGTDGWKIAKAALIGGAIGAIGGGVGAAVEGAIAATTLTGMAGVGFLSGAASSVAEQCAQATLTGQAVPPLEMAKEALTDGAIGAVIGLVTVGVGGFIARRAKKGATAVAGAHQAQKAAHAGKTSRRQSAEVSPHAKTKSARSSNQADKSTVGEPINAVSGEVILTQTDFALPGRIPLAWTRHYGSQNPYSGLLGRGWQTPADARLVLEDDLVLFHDGTPGATVFEALPVDTPVMATANGAILAATPEAYRVQLKSGLTYHFRRDFSAGRAYVTRISDRDGNHLHFIREEGRLTAIQDNAGLNIQVAWQKGRIAALGCLGRVLIQYQYLEDGLVAAVDALGHVRRYAYDDGRLTRHTDRNGLSFYYEYDPKGRCVHGWGDRGLYDCRLDYLPYQRCTRVTNSLGHAWHYHYDADRLPTRVVDPAGAAAVYEYDDVGRVVAVTDPLERTTRYAYDAAGNLLEITRPDDSRMAFAYDDQHRPLQVVDPNDHIWEQQFDAQGRLVAKSSPLGHKTVYSYQRRGDLESVTDPEGRTTRFAWDENGLIASVTQPGGGQSHYQRDAFGNITAVIDPAGKETRYSYDERFRLQAAVSPLGLRQSFEWDPEDNLLLHTDAAGRQTRFEYTGVNEVARRINPDGTVVQYHYDSEEQLIGVTNERGQTHRFDFDPAGRLAAQTDFWGHGHRYDYDPAGQLLQSIDPLGRTIRFAYDRAGRLAAKHFANDQRETFSWDPAGQLIAFESPDTRVERAFDPDNRLIQETFGNHWVQYRYDASGLRTARATSFGNRVAYVHDANGQVAQIAINDQPPIRLQRNAAGQIVSEHLGEHLHRTYGYDEEGRLSHQRTASSLTQIERSYQYDPSGNLIAKQDSRAGDWRYAHDPLGRIVESIDPLHQVRHYTYDPAGDLLKHLPAGTEEYRTATHNGATYRFDNAGNLVERTVETQDLASLDATTQFQWDENNRLRNALTPNGATVDMAYDATGRRVRKSVNGRRTFFAWDGDALLAEKHEDQPAREYVYYPGTFEPLALIDTDGRLYYYHNDLNGLPRELTRPSGQIVWSATYDPLGRVEEIQADDIAQPLRMQGQYWDEEIGLSYNRYRYFDPQICSFISRDPIGLAGGENIYAYAPNVWGWVDPLGLSCKMATPQKLPNELAATFEGGKYSSRVLDEDLILYRAGTKNQPLGQFFAKDAPVSEVQTRIDKAILPEWPGGGKSPIDTVFKVKIPKGTTVHTGKVASQSGFYVGGTQQVVVEKPWLIKGVTVLDSWSIVK